MGLRHQHSAVAGRHNQPSVASPYQIKRTFGGASSNSPHVAAGTHVVTVRARVTRAATAAARDLRLGSRPWLWLLDVDVAVIGHGPDGHVVACQLPRTA